MHILVPKMYKYIHSYMLMYVYIGPKNLLIRAFVYVNVYIYWSQKCISKLSEK